MSYPEVNDLTATKQESNINYVTLTQQESDVSIIEKYGGLAMYYTGDITCVILSKNNW